MKKIIFKTLFIYRDDFDSRAIMELVTILAALPSAPGAASRTDIHRSFKGHLSGERL